MAKKQIPPMLLRDIPDDVHEKVVDEKSRLEKSTGKAGSNPQAIYSLIRRSPKEPKS